MFITTVLEYAHNHWQDNLIASSIWAVPAYLYGRYHLKRIHKHLDHIHKDLADKRKRV